MSLLVLAILSDKGKSQQQQQQRKNTFINTLYLNTYKFILFCWLFAFI